MNKNIRVRFAPSPTGFLHIGGLRTAFYNYLFARQNRGELILRIEDTDQNRLVPKAKENLIKILQTVGIEYKEGLFLLNNKIVQKGKYGPYLQSERLETYKKHALELIENKKAYYCFCTTEELEKEKQASLEQKRAYKYSKKCLKLTEEEIQKKLKNKEPYVIRLNVKENQKIEFSDIIRGKVSFNSSGIDDQVLLKSDGYPTYHLANVVDDHLMEISHVIRGEEWLPSTPKHILLYQAFGWEAPEFAHLPLLLNKDKSKLSKRQGDVAVEDYLKNGYLSQTLLNFVLLLGWNPGTEQEIFTLEEMIKLFDLKKVHKAGAVFDLDKLDWMNGMYIRQLNAQDYTNLALSFLLEKEYFTQKQNNYFINSKQITMEFIEKAALLEKERIKKLSELSGLLDYVFKKEIEYDPQILIWKKSDKEKTITNLENIAKFISNLDDKDFTKDILEQKIKTYLTDNDLNAGDVLWPLRVSLTGKQNSPGPFEVCEVLFLSPWSRELISDRIAKAIKNLK